MLQKNQQDVVKTEKANMRWFMLLLCCGCQIGLFYGYSAPAAIEHQLEHEYTLNEVQYNLLFSIYNIPSLIIVTIAGIICDRYNLGICTLIFCLVIAIGQTIFCLGVSFSSYSLMLIGRFTLGICGEALIAAVLCILAIYFENKEFNFAYGICSAISEGLFTVLSYYITLAIQQRYDCISCSMWIGQFITLFSLLCGVIIGYIEYYRFPKQKEENEKEQKTTSSIQNVIHIWKTEYLNNISVSFILLTMLSFLFYSCVLPWIAIGSLFMQRTYGYSNIEANEYLMIPQGLSMIGIPMFGFLVDYIGHRCELLILASLLLMFGHGQFMLKTFENDQYSDVYYNYDAVSGLIAMGLSFSICTAILFTAINIVLPLKVQGFGMGLMCAAYTLGLVILPIFVGLLIHESNNYKYTQILFFSLSCSSFIICVMLKYIDFTRGKNRLKRKQIKSLTEEGNNTSYGSFSS